MASVSLHTLFDTTLTASADSDPKGLGPSDNSFLATLNVSVINPATTLSVLIQSSPDKIAWYTVGTFTSVVGAPADHELQINRSLYPNIRAQANLSGATQSATFKVRFWYDNNR